MTRRNPYHWRATDPSGTLLVPRDHLVQPIVSDLVDHCANVILVGGLGTGKSVLLERVRAEAEARGATTAIILEEPPYEKTVPAVIRSVLEGLRLTEAEFTSALQAASRVSGAWRSVADLRDSDIGGLDMPAFFKSLLTARGHDRVVLLFDELDHYVIDTDRTTLARDFFNRLERWCRVLKPRLAALAAGGIGVVGLHSKVGSQFAIDARWHELGPLTVAEVDELVRPFETDGRPLDDEARLALSLHTGNHPRLTAYGLHWLWERPGPVTARDVAHVFAEFILREDFQREYWRRVSSEQLSEAGRQVLQVIRRRSGLVPVADLRSAVASARGSLQLSVEDVLRLVRSAGLVAVKGGRTEDPLRIEIVESVLQRDLEPVAPKDTLRAQLVATILPALTWLHQDASAYFQGEGDKRDLVAEAVFASVIARQFITAGWTEVEREATRGAGRTDVKAKHPAFPGNAVVEVKVWDRNPAKDAVVHQQVLDYWTADVGAGLVVMLYGRASQTDWPRKYAERCLDGRCDRYESLPPEAPVAARFAAHSTLDGGRSVVVDHLLLRLSRAGARDVATPGKGARPGPRKTTKRKG